MTPRTLQAPVLPIPFEQSKCGRCIALCCRYFALEIDPPEEPEDFENLRWYVLHENVALFIDDDVWYLQVFSKCVWLGTDNKCSQYERRPTICREYSNDACDYDGAESDETFRTIEELEAYREKWVARWEAKRERRRAAARKAAATRRRRAKTR